jgi:ribosomal protein S18 acetylase RimI-like enzyme
MRAMPDPRLLIRPMRRDELDIAIEWAADEGWNPGMRDAECFAAADPGGFLIGLRDGAPVATISAVRDGAGFAFVGLYIVHPEARGRGYGLAVWEAVMATVARRNVGLDGVPAQQDNYRRSGFALAYRNVRFEGRGGGEAAEPPGLVDLSDVPFPALAAYDRPFFPDDRTAFLHAWVAQPGATPLGVVRDGSLAGYGVMRPCRHGHKIGPLFADDPALAERLLRALRSRAGADEAIYLDVPEPNAAAVALAENHGMSVMFETARMYTGPAPDLPLDRLWGVTTFELG